MRRKLVWGAGIAAACVGLGIGGALLFLGEGVKPAVRGPFDADGTCPTFRASYPQCDVLFGNRGLSVLNSFYETVLGEGAFEIDGFTVETGAAGVFTLTARSNRGPLTSAIVADRHVRLGQDQENARLRRTHQSAYCDAGRIYEHQVVFADDRILTVQELEYWVAEGDLRFRLFQNGALTADVRCSPG